MTTQNKVQVRRKQGASQMQPQGAKSDATASQTKTRRKSGTKQAKREAKQTEAAEEVAVAA
jgi:hypothetical protein